MTVVIYTDASHCPQRKIAACGYVFLLNHKLIKHEIIIIEGGNSGDAEFFAATKAIQEAYLLKGVTKIILNTDFQPITVFRNGYNARGKPMSQEFQETLDMLNEDGIILERRHVKAHNDDRYNEKIDQSCREALKKAISGNLKLS